MFVDKNGTLMKSGSIVLFKQSQKNPHITKSIPSFIGALAQSGSNLILKVPNGGYLVFENDGEPCYELRVVRQ